MMAIIFNSPYITTAERQFTDLGKTTSNTFEFAQTLHHCLYFQANFPGHGNGAQRIADIMYTGQVNTYLKRFRRFG